MSLANWWKRSGTRLIPINSTDITSLSFHPASLMDKHTGLPLPYRNSPCKRFKVSPCYSARRRGMDKRYMGGSCRYHRKYLFLISRYEEMVRRGLRDEHGRFPGKESLPYRAGFLHRPIVDEYRMLLHRWLRQSRLRVPEVKSKSGRSTSRTT